MNLVGGALAQLTSDLTRYAHRAMYPSLIRCL